MDHSPYENYRSYRHNDPLTRIILLLHQQVKVKNEQGLGLTRPTWI